MGIHLGRLQNWIGGLLLIGGAISPARGDGAPPDSAPTPIAQITSPATVDFGRDILPIFRSNCLACHNGKEHQAELSLESPASILKGGEDGAAVIPGNGAGSLLLKAAAHQSKPFMPPKSNKVRAQPLSPQQLGLIQRWIDQGAKGEGSIIPVPVDWHPLPEGLIEINALAISGDGQFAACGRANQVFIYHLPSRRLVTRLTDLSLLEDGHQAKPGLAHRDIVQTLAFSPNGKILASGGFREVKLWQRPQPAVALTLTDPKVKAVTAVAASPDGAVLAVAGDDFVIRLYEASSGKPHGTLAGHAGPIMALRFSADSSKLFSSSKDQTIRVWDVAGSAQISSIKTPAQVTALALLSDGTIISGGSDNLLRTWAAPAVPQQLGGIKEVIVATATMDRRRAAFACRDKKIRVVDLPEGKEIGAGDGPDDVQAISFDSSGTKLLVSAKSQVKVIDVQNHGPAFELTAAQPVTSAVLRPDAKQVATASENGTISLWRLNAPEPRVVAQLPDEITAAAISTDRRLMALAASSNGKLQLTVRELASGKTVQTIPISDGAVTSLAFNSDASQVVCGISTGIAQVFAIADGKQLASLGATGKPITSVAFRSGSAQVLCGIADGTLRLYAVDGTKELRSFPGHSGAIISIATDPSGHQVISASADKSLRIFDAESANLSRSIDLQSPAVSLTVSRDGKLLAVSTQEKGIQIVDLGGGNAKSITDAAASPFLAFDTDGKRLLSLSASKDLTIWNVADGNAMENLAWSSSPSAADHGPVARATVFASFAQAPDEIIGCDGKSVRALPTHLLRVVSPGAGKIARLLYSKDGTTIVAGCGDGTVRGFGSEDGNQRFATAAGPAVLDLAMSPDGQWLAAGGQDRSVHVFTAAGAPGPKPQLGPMDGPVTSVSFSADSKRVIACDGTQLAVFSLDQRNPIEFAECGKLASVCGLTSDANRDAILIAPSEGTAHVWHTCALRQIAGNNAPIVSIQPMPGADRQFVSASADGVVRQWNADGQQVRQFNQDGPINAIALRADGKRIAAAGANKVTRLWNLENGQPIDVRGERYASEFASLKQRLADYANSEIDHWKREIDQANERQNQENQSVSRVTEALAAVEKDVAEKKKQMDEKDAAKAKADRALADAITALADATKMKESTAQAAVTAAAEAQKYKSTVAEARSASQNLASAAASKMQPAANAKSASDQAAADSKNKAQALADAKGKVDALMATAQEKAKAAEEAKKGSDEAKAKAAQKEADDAAAAAKVATDALAPIQKAADDAAAKASAMADAFAAAQKAADQATADAKAAADALAAAEKMSADLDAKANAASTAKGQAEQAFNEATNRKNQAENQAKENDREANRAELTYMTGQINLTSAQKSVTAAKESLAKATAAIANAKTAETAAESMSVKAKAELEAAQKLAGEAEKPVTAVAFANDGADLITATSDGAVHLWGADAGGALETLQPPAPTAGSVSATQPSSNAQGASASSVTAICVAPDGSLLVGSADGSARLWKLSDQWKLIGTIGDGGPESPIIGRVSALAFSPSGALLAVGSGIPSRSGQVKLFSAADRSLVRELPDAHSDTVMGFSFSSDGRLLASCAADKFVKVFSTDDGKLVHSYEGHTNHVLGVSFRYDNRELASCGADNVIKFWDVQSGDQKNPENQQPYPSQVTSISYVGFSPDALVTSGEGNVRFVRPEGVQREFGGADTFLYCGAATPDGSLILAGGQDGILHVWNRDGQQVASFPPPASEKARR